MAPSCQRCGLTTSGPQAFLLTCRGCRKTWHHRCHMPPIEDQELIQLVRATRSGDRNNDLSTWTCRRCKKGASETPSAVSSREATVLSTREDSKGPTSTSASAPHITNTDSLALTANSCFKQESRTYRVDSRPADDRERSKTSDRRALTEAATEKRTLSAKRTKPSPAHVQPQPGPTQPRYTDVQATSHEKKIFPQRPSPPAHSYSVKAARKLPPESAPSAEDVVEMQVDSPPPSVLRATSRASQATPSIGSDSASDVPPRVRVVSSSDDMEREVTVAGVAIQPPVNRIAADEMDDDPEDLYGPPVERRIIRILPSLAEELKEQQRRVAAEKEKRRAPLAPDWILARHVNDPLWKDIPTGGQKRRKPIARKLGDDRRNLMDLMSCFTVQNWVREHKT